MFHRVKSEVQNENEKPEEARVEETQETQAETTELKTPQTTLEMEAEAEQDNEQQDAAEEVTPTEDTQPPEPEEEDIFEMTDNDETQTDIEDTTEEAISPYQRTGTAPAASGYPGSSYPGTSSFGTTSSAAADSDRRLTIGKGITMSGEIEACDYLLVEGTVEAALKGANMLEVAESGTFYGTVEIEEANISGRFEGDITVNGRLTISSTGTVTGSISYKELEIEAGAVVDGRLTPLSAVPAAAAKPSSKAKKDAPKAKKVEAQPEPANTDEGLFSKATAAAE